MGIYNEIGLVVEVFLENVMFSCVLKNKQIVSRRFERMCRVGVWEGCVCLMWRKELMVVRSGIFLLFYFCCLFFFNVVYLLLQLQFDLICGISINIKIIIKYEVVWVLNIFILKFVFWLRFFVFSLFNFLNFIRFLVFVCVF